MSGTGYGFNHDSSVVIGEGGLEDSQTILFDKSSAKQGKTRQNNNLTGVTPLKLPLSTPQNQLDVTEDKLDATYNFHQESPDIRHAKAQKATIDIEEDDIEVVSKGRFLAK